MYSTSTEFVLQQLLHLLVTTEIILLSSGSELLIRHIFTYTKQWNLEGFTWKMFHLFLSAKRFIF